MAKKAKIEQPKVVETPKARTLEEIQKEYNDLAVVAGDKNYRVEILKSEINQHYQRMLVINQEANELKNATA
jgi:hypothetical protein